MPQYQWKITKPYSSFFENIILYNRQTNKEVQIMGAVTKGGGIFDGGIIWIIIIIFFFMIFFGGDR